MDTLSNTLDITKLSLFKTWWNLLKQDLTILLFGILIIEIMTLYYLDVEIQY